MASVSAHPFLWRMSWLSAMLVLVAVAGCQKSMAIGHYQVPKEEAADRAPSGETTASPDRMVAAIVPHGVAAWFFKLAGPTDAVSKYTAAFEQLVASVTFPESAAAQPQWTLPKGWEQKSGGAEMRFATITIPDKPPLELTVTTLPWPEQGQLEQLLSNVNRWRGQMTLKPLDTVDLADQLRPVKTPAGEAMLVDFKGTLKAAAMQPPFAAAAAGDAPGSNGENKKSLPAGHPPITTPTTEHSQSSSSSEVAQAAQPELPFKFTLPEGWTASPLPPFAVAAFSVKKDSHKAEITVSPLGRGAGGMLSNVNRWRSQIKLPEISSDDLNSLTKPFQVDGKAAQMVQLVGPEAASPRLAITVVVLDRDDATWFFRMRGDAELVKDEQPNFEKFVGSVKFRDAGK
jgi:hypothetical protein